MELKVGMRLLVRTTGWIFTLTNIGEEEVMVHCKNFIGAKKIDFSKDYIKNGLLHGTFRVVRDRKNNFW